MVRNNRVLRSVGAVALAFAMFACGRDASEQELRGAKATTDGTMIVRGTASSALAVDNGRAIAIGTDGRKFWTQLDRDGDFTLKLPVGQSYRIVIAKTLASGWQQIVGTVVLRAGTSATTKWIGANDAVVVDLGKIRAAQSSTALATRTGGTACSGCAGGDDDDDDADDDDDDDRDTDADHDDDDDCHESKSSGGASGGGGDDDDKDDDADDDCKVCSSGSGGDLSPSKDPGSKCADEDDHADDKDDGEDDRCPSAD